MSINWFINTFVLRSCSAVTRQGSMSLNVKQNTGEEEIQKNEDGWNIRRRGREREGEGERKKERIHFCAEKHMQDKMLQSQVLC